jgi:hypothetical protein
MTALGAVAAIAIPWNASPEAVRASEGSVTVIATERGRAATFVPAEALGATLDGQSSGDTARVYRRRTIDAMLSTGFEPVSYRLRTELACEAWHWNPVGTWSDARRRRGYWTSRAELGAPIRVSRGYRLPRRGNTIDQADDDGYSRIDDGDPTTFWKSNPYLDRRYTHEDDALHPQHVVLDLGDPYDVDAIQIQWAIPYATAYEVQYWVGDDAIDDQAEGKWVRFPSGAVTDGRGGDALVRLTPAPISVRYVRVLMTASSGRAPAGSRDVRDGLGYAIREVSVGKLSATGALVDVVEHAPDRKRQTIVYVSSTDPWHRAEDLDPDLEQPGLDLFFTCGITRGLPAMVPVSILYGTTPEDAATEIRYLAARGYPVGRVEMGEEPDGQYVQPEDYAALYLEWADAIHAVDAKLALGGAAFQSTQDTIYVWPDANGDPLWVERFVRYMRSRNRLSDFAFFSFEWYPFDDLCESVERQLVEANRLLDSVFANFRREGLPDDIPKLATEYGYSSYAGQVEVDLPGALVNADFIGHFLSTGGAGAYCYGLEPGVLGAEPECKSYGGLMMFLQRSRGRELVPVAAYHGARLLTGEWTQFGAGAHELHRVTCDVADESGSPLVTAYAVHRPDGLWAVMLVNKDSRRSWPVSIRFAGESSSVGFDGNVDVYQLSSDTYVWHANGPSGYADPNAPAAHRSADAAAPVVLPPYSLTVVRGRVSP